MEVNRAPLPFAYSHNGVRSALLIADAGGTPWPQLKHGGAFVSTLTPPAEQEATARGARASLLFTQTNAQHLEEIARFIEKGVIKVDVTKTSARSGTASGGGVVGKVVLRSF